MTLRPVGMRGVNEQDEPGVQTPQDQSGDPLALPILKKYWMYKPSEAEAADVD